MKKEAGDRRQETGQRATHMKQSQLATCRVAYPWGYHMQMCDVW